jgi:hypothetical protein
MTRKEEKAIAVLVQERENRSSYRRHWNKLARWYLKAFGKPLEMDPQTKLYLNGEA